MDKNLNRYRKLERICEKKGRKGERGRILSCEVKLAKNGRIYLQGDLCSPLVECSNLLTF